MLPSCLSSLMLFLKAPGEIGVYCAMTGARLDGPDMVFAHLADHFIDSSQVSITLEEGVVDGYL